MRYEAAKRTITQLTARQIIFRLQRPNSKIAYVGIGVPVLNDLGKRLKEDWNADTYFFTYQDTAAAGNQQRQTAFLQS